MKVLIDTHIFLWYITADKRIKKRYVELISDLNNEVYLSVASVWECIIKSQLGKLVLPDKPSRYIPEKRQLHQILPLEIEENVFVYLENLPADHKDPFDRIIISQALQNNMKLITEDQQIKKYALPIFI